MTPGFESSRRRRAWTLGALLLGALGLSLGLLLSRTRGSEPAQVPSLKPALDADLRAWRWTVEVRQVRQQSFVPGAPPLRSSVLATFTVDVERVSDSLLELHLVGLDRFEAHIGEDAVPTPSVEGLVARLELGPRGQVLGLSLPKEAPSAVAGLLRLVASEAQRSSGEGNTWEVDEETELGKLHARYSEGVQSGDGRRHLDKVWVGASQGGTPFAKVAGGARYTLNRDGGLDELDADRTVLLEGSGKKLLLEARVQVSLRRVASLAGSNHPRIASALPRARPLSAPPEAEPAPDARERSLAERVGGLELPELRATLARESTLSGQARSDFLWRASGRLLLHPEESEAIGLTLEDPTVGAGGKLLAFELLASAGTPQAQAAMVHQLQALQQTRSPGELGYLERLIAVAKPEVGLVDHVEHRMEGLSGVGKAAVALVLGALGSHLEPPRRAALASTFVGLLAAADLASSREDVAAAAAYVRALGNLGAPEGEASILSHATSASTAVRAASAVALRRYDGPEADAALASLSLDPAAEVQRASLGVLGERPAQRDVLLRWSEALRDRELGEPSLGALLNVVSRWRKAEPEASARCLQQVFERRALPAKLRARALELRKQIAAAAP